MSIPNVFISYSHDSQEHKMWVLNFATRLRNNGINAILDQWELKPGDDLPHFMETNLAKSDFILMVCTNRYVEKANKGSGGVGYEKMIITSNLIAQINENKIIPIIRQLGYKETPTFLKTKLYIDFSVDDDYEFNFDELLRTLHQSPLFEKPNIGNNPFKDVSKTNVNKNDGVLDLMKEVVKDYENGNYSTNRNDLLSNLTNSRIVLDLLIKKAADQKLIYVDTYGDLILSDNGKQYALDNKLIIE